ncbi:MAG: hypothetical protein V5A44_11005, partial [Haloarculaceae archaeon]
FLPAEQATVVLSESCPGVTVTADFDGTNWHVEYRPVENIAGGGPEYVISGETGDIVDKNYWQ